MRGDVVREASVSNDNGRALRDDGNAVESDMPEERRDSVPELLREPYDGIGDAPGIMRDSPRTGVFSGMDGKRDAPPGAGVPGSMSRRVPRPEAPPRGVVSVEVPRRLRASPRDALPSPPMVGMLSRPVRSSCPPGARRRSEPVPALPVVLPRRISARPGAVSGCIAEAFSSRTLRIEEPRPARDRSMREPVWSTAEKRSRPMRDSSACTRSPNAGPSCGAARPRMLRGGL